jgi:phospholipid transport system substrate-binding protein
LLEPRNGKNSMQITGSVQCVALGLCLLLAVAATSANAAVGAGITGGPAALSSRSNASAASEAEKFVQTNIDNGFLILNKDSDATERRRQFREFLFTLVDTKRIALFTLGPYARQASGNDLETFLTAYDNFVAAMLQGYFDWYKGEDLRVASSMARSADDVVVFADILGPNGTSRFRAGFRVRHDSAGNNVVTDFQFEGVWFALNHRADFTSYLQRHSGSFAGLSTELDKRTERFKKDWAPPTK